jgi:hypothetical protein
VGSRVALFTAVDRDAADALETFVGTQTGDTDLHADEDHLQRLANGPIWTA